MSRYAILIAIAAILVPSSAFAARQPTRGERQAITAALPADVQRYAIGCVFLRTLVSNNGRYATVAPDFLSATRLPCVKYASNGYWILRKTAAAGWKIVFNGSVRPPCSLRIPRDLVRCA